MPDAELRYIQAVNKALDWALREHDDTVVFGEDVAIPGGPFGATKGLYDRYGADRIFDTPISETAFLGMALGAAMTGLRPIAEIMYADFLFVAMDQVVNQIAYTRYATRGGWTAPLVIRLQQGFSPGSCAQHSKSIEAYLAHTPGIRLAVPSNASDAYQMLRTAVESDDPVVVAESRMLYPTKGPVDLDATVESAGGTRRLREGGDVTLVSWARGVQVCTDAAEQLADNGVQADVFDLRWLNPLDLDPVIESAVRTRRLVVAHEANLTGGFGAEVVARVSEAAGDNGTALRTRRLGLPDIPMPAAPALQQAVVLKPDSVIDAVGALVGDRIPQRELS